MTEPNSPEVNGVNRFKPEWAVALEAGVAAAVPLGRNALAAIKLLLLTPLAYLILRAPGEGNGLLIGLVAVFVAFVAADFIAGAKARAAHEPAAFGRVLDRVADYPLLFVAAWFAWPEVSGPLLILKLLIDLLILVLYLIGRGDPGNRLRSGANYATLLALLLIALGRGDRLFIPEVMPWLLVANIIINSAAALYNLNIIQKRFIADALSGANLLCGVASMVFASRGRYEISLLFLMLGAAFDGFDGAAARRFGGTSWGVYSDDVADGVNYGIAPGVALWFALPGVDGWILGPFYTIFTLSRLVYFTLNKSGSDPNFFSGVPSTLGGLITLSALVLFPGHPALIGLLVGVAGVLMVSFDAQYRHLGRALGQHKHAFYGMPVLLIVLLGGNRLFGPEAPVALILAACLAYGFKPNVKHMSTVIANYRQGENQD